MNNNLQLYLNIISSTIGINEMDDEFGENDIQIPYSLVQEKNAADKFIESIKFCIRHCVEYPAWVKSFHNRFGPAVCSVSDNTTTIEVHHHPLTLEDYVNIALNFIIDNKLTYSTNLVADLVIRWHYSDIIGACFMSKTYHKRFHDIHDISIPEDSIHWDIEKFFNDEIIKQYIDEDIISKIVNYMPSTVSKHKNLFKNININFSNDTNFRAPE